MAIAAPTPPIAYAELLLSKAGVGSGVLVPAEMLLPGREVATQQIIPVTISLDATVNARPESVLFGALADPALRLRKAIPLEVSGEESVVVSWEEADEFGCGATLGAALDDFGSALAELYHRLYDETVQLGPDLENVKRVLDGYIEPRTK